MTQLLHWGEEPLPRVLARIIPECRSASGARGDDIERTQDALSAAEPFYGVWKMRPSGKPGDTLKQTMTIEPAGDGLKVTSNIDFGNGTGMVMAYVTKLDGAEVPVYSSGKVVMTLRAKRTGLNTYEGSTTGQGGTSTFKTILSADGKTITHITERADAFNRFCELTGTISGTEIGTLRFRVNRCLSYT